MSNVSEAMRRIAAVGCLFAMTGGCTKLTEVDWSRIAKAPTTIGAAGANGENGGAPSDVGEAAADTGGDGASTQSELGGATSGGAAGAGP